MEGQTPVTPPPDLRIRSAHGPGVRGREEREEEDARDILESVFIDDQTSDGQPGESPVWVEIPPDDISLRAAQTLYPLPARRKRFDERTLLAALGVVTTLSGGVILFLLARGPSRPTADAVPPPAAAATAAAEVASPPAQPLPATPFALPDTAPLTSPVERSPAATTLTVPDPTPATRSTPAVRDSPAAKAAAAATARLNAQTAARPPAPVAARPSVAAPPPPASAPSRASAPASAAAPSSAPARSASPATSASPTSVRPAPEATIGSRPQPPVPPLAGASANVESPAPAPVAPVAGTPPLAATPPAATPPAAANAAAAPAAAPPAVPPPAAATPPPSPAAVALAADEQSVRAVVERYRAAYSALDVGAVRAIWPRVNARALGRAFDQLSTQQLDFAGCEISVTGERASAGCSGNMEFVPKVGNKTPRLEARTWSFELRKSGTQWTIEAVESR